MTDSSTTLTTAAVMRLAPVIPVLTIDRIEDAVPLAAALTAGGLYAIEVTLRTPAALEAITAIATEVPDAVVGAGTVLNARHYELASDAGARFIVSPGLTDGLIGAAADSEVPLLAGTANASDIMRGLEAGLTHFKFFPAETSGGAAAIKALGGPFGDVRFCPTGGISLKTAPDYLALPNVLCVGGGWVAPAAAVEARDWGRITELAREAAALKR
ncbi:bifunctional 4-hydroxy-2-oxoglutarate aldolase/2-dehydro-3-deoxy-phosphogluconate aldolase [Phenylobacterium montanum]|uniref:2-dehydro-3-deoxy-phosphogluconate aldolase n=1 Tax=Phenylobacterium montanum TaxID=2823693 RepID=A0A975IVN8_9CAUL|nr:bifunctional 4-hydroxy-2-oxoglutarate aldolase/2-dehydro-3-deoxy-phosphogluconate aldolase [Caulobacter sp. S6]QUD88754.1 bifunctional 4-hydroxy-2-oxoglutarate aldolase/2-dehydro-3-deoxy-phosphogluconate aldolase [Caulobacter sp. S6]